MRQWVANKDVNPEAEESTAFEAVTKQRLAKTQLREKTARTEMNCRVGELTISL
jgi:hypothetical protein